MKRLAVLFSLAALALAASAHAAPATFSIDPVHSQVGFGIRHFFSRVQGSFTDFAGTVSFDDKSFPTSTVECTIQAKSINTSNDRRDADLRGPNFFDVEKNPTLAFKSTSVTEPKDGKFQVKGDLTLHGVTKPVTLDCEFLGAGDTGMGGHSMGFRAGFEATTAINRKDFGMVWNRTLDQGGTMLGDDVTINLHIEAVRQQPAAK